MAVSIFDSVESLLTIIMLVVTRDLVETLGIEEAVMVRWLRLEMEKISITVECPR